MKDRTNEQILKERKEIIEKTKFMLSKKDDLVFLESYFNEDVPENVNIPVYYLGKSLKVLAEADIAVFGKGWKCGRGCLVEHEVCQSYGIKVLYL
jgi:hypothetical protein